MKEVFCSDCRHYSDYGDNLSGNICKHPANMKFEKDYRKKYEAPRSTPNNINEDNDCDWFEDIEEKSKEIEKTRTYTVATREVWTKQVEVVADNPMEAKRMVENGEGDRSKKPYFLYIIDSEDWTVSEEISWPRPPKPEPPEPHYVTEDEDPRK
tara:strand:+ start:3163 stop:3624 length:462 start_codon:yes stop_codon:yes gene_type:complete